MPTHRSIRGEVTVALILVCTLAGIAGIGGFAWGRNSAKKETEEAHRTLTARAAAADQAVKDAEAATVAAITANTEAIAKDTAKDRSAAGFVAGAAMALEREPNPSVYVRSAILLNGIAADTLPTITPRQKEEFTKILDELLENEALLSATLEAKKAEAGELKTQTAAAQASAAAANTRAADAAKRAVELNAQLQEQIRIVNELTKEKDGLLAWIKTIGWVVGGLWLLSLIIPVVSKAVPALAPLASVVGTLWAPGVQMLKSGAERLVEKADKIKADMVALQEFTKKKMAKKFNEADMTAFKKEVKDWWEGDLEAQNEVERIKAGILRA